MNAAMERAIDAAAEALGPEWLREDHEAYSEEIISKVDLRAVVVAVVKALNEPTESMEHAGADAEDAVIVHADEASYSINPKRIWQEMVYELLRGAE